MSRLGHEEPMEVLKRFPMDASFKIFRRFNQEDVRPYAGARGRTDRRALAWFDGDSFPDRIARSIVAREAIVTKELFEAFEFFARSRRTVRRPLVVDVSAGHGLTGLLFAAFERQVEKVLLVDPCRPDSSEAVFDAVAECAPWIREKIEWVERPVQDVMLPAGRPPGILGVHACGQLTDRAIDLALTHDAPIALLPCCYHHTAESAPAALRAWLGAELTTDIHRTYRLEESGYAVVWTAIPRVITPKNRLLLGRRRHA